MDQFELAALLAQCGADHSPAGVRDAAVIGLAYMSGTVGASSSLFIWTTWTPSPLPSGWSARAAISVRQ